MASSSIPASALYDTKSVPTSSAVPRTRQFAFSLPASPALWLSDIGKDPAQWDDMSGNGRHAVQATAGNQPSIQTNILNGRQVRRFDGSTDGMTGTMTLEQPFTVVTVYKVTATGSTQSAFHGGNSSLGVTAGNFFLFAGAVISGSANTNFNINTHVFNGASSAIFSNGVSLVNADAQTNNISNFSIGYRAGPNDEYFGGDIAEIIVYPVAFTEAQRLQTEAYFNHKYAIY